MIWLIGKKKDKIEGKNKKSGKLWFKTRLCMINCKKVNWGCDKS